MSPESIPTKPMGKFAASTKLTRAAWRTLMLNKELFVASLLSMAVSVAVFIVFVVLIAVLVISSDSTVASAATEYGIASDALIYASMAIYLFISFAIANYFSGAIAHAALVQFRGQDPTLKESLAAAYSKAGPLLAFSGLQATVGLILNILSDRLPFAGKIATWIAGAAWSVASMFALPIIMDNKETNPLKVVRHSSQIFTKVWGESTFIGVGLGLIGIAIGVFMFFILAGGVALSVIYMTWVFGAIGAGLFLIGLMIFGVVLSALSTIVKSAAYYYASTNQLPAGFDEELIRSVFRPKKAWLK